MSKAKTTEITEEERVNHMKFICFLQMKRLLLRCGVSIARPYNNKSLLYKHNGLKRETCQSNRIKLSDKKLCEQEQARRRR